MVKKEYPHFNPKKYGLDVKIATVKTSYHSKYNINYHFVFIPKYRRKLLTGKVEEVLKIIIEGQCQDLGVEMLALEVMPDHVHLFIGSTPNHTPWEIIKQIKGNTSIQLRRVFPNLKTLGWGRKIYPNLWARGYYCGSAGHVSQDAVKRYILEQQGKDVFEYNVFGGQSAIGDFTKFGFPPIAKAKGIQPR